MIQDGCSPPRPPFELMAPIIASPMFRCGECIDADGLQQPPSLQHHVG
jgi:hypothetical protein